MNLLQRIFHRHSWDIVYAGDLFRSRCGGRTYRGLAIIERCSCPECLKERGRIKFRIDRIKRCSPVYLRSLPRLHRRIEMNHPMCKNSFPCLCNMYILAGLETACDVCESSVQAMREIPPLWTPVGKFWRCGELSPEQVKEIDGLIAMQASDDADAT